MMISTNLSKTCKSHDLILYSSLEKQVYDLFRLVMVGETIGYELDRDGFTFTIEGDIHRYAVQITKKSARITMVPPYSFDDIKFGSYNDKYPNVILPYNTSLISRLAMFKKRVDKVREMAKKAAEIRKPDNNTIKRIDAFLKKELGTSRVTVSFWRDSLFEGGDVRFCIHPKNDAPAAGAYVALKDGKIVPDGEIERAVGYDRDYGTDVESLKRRIADIEKVKEKIAAFDATKCPELVSLLKVKNDANKLVDEFRAV